MAQFQPVRGTHDILPDDYARFRHVVDTARQAAQLFGYREMATPIFEFTDVFARSMGETSDAVSKEMYSINDRGGENLALRPEYTAGICRAFISNGQQQNVPFKAFAWGPMFRYERPQKGRQRQFHQIDVEVIGAAEPQADVEVIALGAEILRRLGILDKCTLELNTLGDPESRVGYRDALVKYFSGYADKLSEDSRKRLEKNPLRILDSKDEGDRKLVADAPLIHDYLTPAARDFFKVLQDGLAASDVPFTVSPRLVRGLDYYTHTAFEFVTTHLGAQGAVIAGGRYDGLIEQLGGKPTPGIGWAGGIERLVLLSDPQPVAPRIVAIIPIGAAAEAEAVKLAGELRRADIAVELAYGGNVGKRFKRADKVGCHAAVVIGDDEIANGVVKLKDFKSGEEASVARAELLGKLKV
ncbi:histidine--tRNA ligase [Ferrovibrio terrae]|uniref:Histidine--tRNA ligase n=1 Tax=Ferrovibrio terrae TaxID=2594003 RepID=A0A516H266_9PROT|nr:histidine--tRNA ligase [Ferrovibrio terrae]QDO97835.1 histidine--tRNA ligase [Ferrovibrio terrae]